MDIFNQLNTKLTDSKKFYFLEYFYIVLKSIHRYQAINEIFESFKILKENLSLGESKYKKLGIVVDELTSKQIGRYKYTFNEVIEECRIYELIITKGDYYYLSDKGQKLLDVYENKGSLTFNEELFKLIEAASNGFYYFVNSLYEINPNNGGMIIFPIYSPLKLQIQKDTISTGADILNYLQILVKKMEQDMKTHLAREFDLREANDRLVFRLLETGLIVENKMESLLPENYNVILKRIRDYWLNFFLKEIYNIKVSLSYFDIWIYRAKHLGILNTTEFYPNFNGKIVYPVSILFKGVASSDFRKIYSYPNELGLYLHEPKWGSFQEDFVNEIYNSYYDLKRSNRSYFINLLDLSEIVCYKLKLSYKTFVDFLEKSYQLNLKGKLGIKISLEADRLPFETKAMYLKRDPIIIDGKLRNIIAIDLINNE